MKTAQWLRLLWLAAFSSSAQVQEAWVNHYNGGYTNLSHSPIGLALDSSGNVLVAGSSQSSAPNSDYVPETFMCAGSLPPAAATIWLP